MHEIFRSASAERHSGLLDPSREFADLLGSLSPVLNDEDDGVAEALLRDGELDTNPAMATGPEELDRQVQRRQR